VPNASLFCEEIEKNGFATCEAVVSAAEVEELRAAINQIKERARVRKKIGVFAVRNLLEESPEVRKLACSPVMRRLIESVLGTECQAVRGILFDKVPDANWKVPWHQDVTIAVQRRIESEGFGPWSMKGDVLHVQPPAAVLEKMLSVRLHLDPCGEANGALRVIPGSHRWGRIAEEQIPSIRATTSEHACVMGIGDVLLMRPLLLHASSASRVPDHRRVVHLDFAAAQLPPGMGWFSEPRVREFPTNGSSGALTTHT
jgi:ectoine hydroxylase-related dioxygenase (phytanoyl-CoA dioxygenase family)